MTLTERILSVKSLRALFGQIISVSFFFFF